MTTLNQRLMAGSKRKKDHFRAPVLKKHPQLKGVVIRIKIVTPRKPNSARRPVAKIVLSSKRRVTAHIPGSGHNLRRHSNVLVRGGGARDLPGVRYTCIRGAYDLQGVVGKSRRRSIYGLKWPDNKNKKKRRKFRKL